MAVRIRLQRHGRKGRPFYYVVAADARAKRDGRYIERIGSYNPMTNPATIEIDSDRALDWLTNGAEMSDTARALLRYRGVLLRHHLAKGVRKGALTEEQAEAKYQAWLADKGNLINAKLDSLTAAADAEHTARMKAEKAVSDKRAAEIALANTPLIEEPVVEEAPVEATEEVAEAAPEEAIAEAAPEAPAAEEAAPEAPAAEEAAPEAPAAEEAAAEEPAADATEEEKAE